MASDNSKRNIPVPSKNGIFVCQTHAVNGIASGEIVPPKFGPTCAVCEIERLTREQDEAKAETLKWEGFYNNIDTERDRLRAALKEIARKDWHIGITLIELQAIANAALSGEPPSAPVPRNAEALKTMRDMLHVAERSGSLVTLTVENCKEVIRAMEGSAPETFGEEPWRIALPVITDELREQFGSDLRLIDNDRQWTQDAVDFACMLQGERQSALKAEVKPWPWPMCKGCGNEPNACTCSEGS